MSENQENMTTPKKRLVLWGILIIVVVALVFNVLYTTLSNKVGPLQVQLAKQEQELATMNQKFIDLSKKVGEMQAVTSGVVNESARHDQVLRAGYDLYKAQLKSLNATVGEMGKILGEVPEKTAPTKEVTETAPVVVSAPALEETTETSTPVMPNVKTEAPRVTESAPSIKTEALKTTESAPNIKTEALKTTELAPSIKTEALKTTESAKTDTKAEAPKTTELIKSDDKAESATTAAASKVEAAVKTEVTKSETTAKDTDADSQTKKNDVVVPAAPTPDDTQTHKSIKATPKSLPAPTAPYPESR